MIRIAFLTMEIVTSNLVVKEILWRLIRFAVLNTLIGLLFFSLEFSLRLKRVPNPVLYASTVMLLVVWAFSAANHIHHGMWTVMQINGHDPHQSATTLTIQPPRHPESAKPDFSSCALTSPFPVPSPH